MIREAIDILKQGKDLNADQMALAIEEVMSGKAATQSLVFFLEALALKGETVDEITSAVTVMRKYAVKINSKQKIILDTCGTGGDKKGLFNVSTAVAFVAAGCGISVAKHGNRSVSSASGSADCLEALGMNINMGKEQLEGCLEKTGIAFLFAQALHPAMKYAMPARKQIGKKTIFNILGPLTNPAGATHQLVGVYETRLTEPVARVLNNLGTVHALVVSSKDGLDELSLSAPTSVTETRQGKINNYEIDPQEFGLRKASMEELKGGTAAENAKILLEVLRGENSVRRDMVLLNAGAAIYAADKASSIKEGVKLAADSIDSGRALEKLELLRSCSLNN